ncbi:hypothetical protein CL622_01410 [archaeon]|nr:hypothetical protein [archaeon]
MISSEILAKHYREYASRPQDWVDLRAHIKKQIVQDVFEQTGFSPTGNPVKIAVLGASDKRYIAVHHTIFTEAVQKDVAMITFDLDEAHLAGAHGIVEHDVTSPFPETGFELIFSHALMKFILPQEQAVVLKNAYNALAPGGLAMHILHFAELKGGTILKDWQYRADVEKIVAALAKDGIICKPISLNIDGGTVVLVTQK